MRRINNKLRILVFALVLMLGIGFAAISTTLTITGNSGISGDSANFQDNVFFASANLTSTGLQSSDQNAAKPRINGREMTFTIPSTSPLKVVGDRIEVDYTIRNESNYKALIAVPNVTSSSTDFLDYFTVTHSRTANLELGVDQTSDTQKLTLTLKKTYADIDVKQFSFTVKINAIAMEATINGSNNGNGVVVSPVSRVSGDGTHVGDEVAIGNEHFYVIGTEDGNTKLLSKYNLHVGNVADSNWDTTPLISPTGKQESNARGTILRESWLTFMDDVTEDDFDFPWIGTVPFSESNYWYNEGSQSEFLYNHSEYVYNSNASIKIYVDNYKTYLETMGLSISEARLISYEELISLGCIDYYNDDSSLECLLAESWVYLTTYWTGSVSSNERIWYVNSYGMLGFNYYNNDYQIGVRPVIIIDSSLIG